MKTLFFILGIVLMVGCCTSNVTTQYVAKGVVLLPDYTYLLEGKKYCCVDTVVQNPEPGYFIETDKNPITISVIGFDCFGNTKIVEFDFATLKSAY